MYWTEHPDADVSNHISNMTRQFVTPLLLICTWCLDSILCSTTQSEEFADLKKKQIRHALMAQEANNSVETLTLFPVTKPLPPPAKQTHNLFTGDGDKLI